MARTKQTARKSTPGRAPHRYPDHTGNLYTVVDGPLTNCTGTTPAIRKLGIHLYSLSPLSPSPEAVGGAILSSDGIQGWGNARNYWPRVDVYPPMGSIEACIEHHQREKVYRAGRKREMMKEVADAAAKAYAKDCVGDEVRDEEDAIQEAIAKLRGKEPLPHIVPTWCCAARFWGPYDYRTRYRSFILVVPERCSTWEDIKKMGLWVVNFDLDWGPAMDTEMEDWESEWDEGALIVEKTGWVWVDKVEKDPLFDIFVMGLDEHYFDEDGQCVACRRATEYRRRSKRIAKRKVNSMIIDIRS
ncbi:hypothetical protein ASPCADRAFT_510422 [Aspergillus carbonarius ITEM 5010]|uniref:Uncharacterized protein n=1 Tax=Aspergillus carbonarius (strain ITEM 5010) TaxID=602072 RepID=A0A1R3R8V0_ASPC5|nr:hypothetical protein ASPCADRAFT_510422 [Aspergillus carbonarius ITEM 5010]